VLCVTDPLFAALPGPAGPLRRALDAKLAEIGDAADPVLTLVVQSLADRIDWAIGGRQYRGFVMITAEFRAAYRELVPAVVADDSFEQLIAEIAAGDDTLDGRGAAITGAEVRNTA
jgi:hypothetical protein